MPTHLKDILTALAGVALILWVISDVFQAIIVPHYRPNRLRLSHMISKVLWVPLRYLAKKFPNSHLINNTMAMYAPAAMMTLLVCWLTVMMMGYSLILWSERAHINPHLRNFDDAIYFAATSVLTVGFGDVVACTFLSRATVVCSAVSGIVLLALTVSFLFATQSHFHNREVNSQIIAARSRHRCAGLLLFENLRRKADATSIYELCERWIIDIYQSHSAYPMLMYFRSRSSRVAWLSQMGAVLDLAALLLTIGPEQHSDVAHSIFDAGSRALAVFSKRLTLRGSAGAEQDQFKDYVKVFRAMKQSDPVSAARRFESYRKIYQTDLQLLCEFFAVEPPEFSSANLEEFCSDAALEDSRSKRVVAPGRTQEIYKKPENLIRK